MTSILLNNHNKFLIYFLTHSVKLSIANHLHLNERFRDLNLNLAMIVTFVDLRRPLCQSNQHYKKQTQKSAQQ